MVTPQVSARFNIFTQSGYDSHGTQKEDFMTPIETLKVNESETRDTLQGGMRKKKRKKSPA
jgi:hypothetical protein